MPETKAAIEQARLLIEQAEALGEPPEDPLLLFSGLGGQSAHSGSGTTLLGHCLGAGSLRFLKSGSQSLPSRWRPLPQWLDDELRVVQPEFPPPALKRASCALT